MAGWQEGHPDCKKWVVRYWRGYVWSKVQMIFIWSSWCHCHPIISCSRKIQNGLPFWYWLTQVVLEKRSLNGYCNSSKLPSLFNAHFPNDPGPANSLSISSSSGSGWEEPFGISGTGFCGTDTLPVIKSSASKTLKATQSTDYNQRHRLNLSSTTGYSMSVP